MSEIEFKPTHLHGKCVLVHEGACIFILNGAKAIVQQLGHLFCIYSTLVWSKVLYMFPHSTTRHQHWVYHWVWVPKRLKKKIKVCTNLCDFFHSRQWSFQKAKVKCLQQWIFSLWWWLSSLVLRSMTTVFRYINTTYWVRKLGLELVVPIDFVYLFDIIYFDVLRIF